ncbi:MAG: FG-GAP repeat protein [Planctomycetes bacterium]|nr:FG-GAP repeat protein [Planctomycetota bacterium]
MAGRWTAGCVALVAAITGGDASAQVWLAELESSDLAAADHFGGALASAGTRVLVGARHHDDGAALPDSGAAYVFVESGGAYLEEARLTPYDPVPLGKFGAAVDLDGVWAIVGAPDARTNGLVTGAAYVFERRPSGWVPGTRLDALLPATGARFGWSVAVEGEWAAVGAYGDAVAAFSGGAVHLFHRDAVNGWQHAQELRPPDPAPNHFFGTAVDLSDGRLAVGAPGDDDAALDAGAVYVYARSGAQWVLEDKLVASGAPAHAWLGGTLSLDGPRLAAGATSDPTYGLTEGFVAIAERGAGSWTVAAVVQPSELTPGDRFGAAVHLAGEQLVVGAPGFDGAAASGGAAWIFTHVGAGWLDVRRTHAPATNLNERYGSAVRFAAGRLFVGGEQDAEHVAVAGSVQVWGLVGLPVPTSYCGGGCPCGNEVAGRGCANSTGAGARLSAAGSLVLGGADLTLIVEGLVPRQSVVVLASATSALQPFGDGVRCVGPAVRVAAPQPAREDGTLVVGPGLARLGGLGAGPVCLQAWYRDPYGSPCSGGSNFSNALALELAP